jgi:Zn-dependent protease
MVIFFSILVLWVISLCLHEYAHARVAYAGGDHTVVEKGYLTLNPLRYVHPFMSIVIPLIILAVGGVPLPGGAVYIEHHRLRSRHWDAAVSAAGPAANLVILLFCGALFAFGVLDPADRSDTIGMTVALFAGFQGLAFALNMLPIPGLDGFGILAPYLPPDIRRQANEMATIGFILLLVVMLNPNPVRDAFWQAVTTLVIGVGIPHETLADGGTAFEEFKREYLPFGR